MREKKEGGNQLNAEDLSSSSDLCKTYVLIGIGSQLPKRITIRTNGALRVFSYWLAQNRNSLLCALPSLPSLPYPLWLALLYIYIACMHKAGMVVHISTRENRCH